jgi:hypothetical protein
MRTSIRSTPYTMAACSLSPLPLHLPLQDSKVPSGPHFQINPTIHRQLHVCVLTHPPWCYGFPHARHRNVPIIGMHAMIDILMFFKFYLIFFMFDDMLYPAILQAMIPRHPCNRVLARDAEQVAALLQSSVGFVSSYCVAAIPVSVRPQPTGKYYPDAAPHASSTCFCTSSGIYVHQLQRHHRFALVHGMSSLSRQFPGNPM